MKHQWILTANKNISFLQDEIIDIKIGNTYSVFFGPFETRKNARVMKKYWDSRFGLNSVKVKKQYII